MSRFLRLALVLVPVLTVGLGSAVAVGAVLLTDSVAQPPASAASTGSTRVTGGAPGGSGITASADECAPPCTPTAGATPGSQPVGVGYVTGHSTEGSGDTSRVTPSGVPTASGLGLLGSQSAGAVTPSGGAATGAACLSVLSSIPLPDLSGKGFTCGAPGPLGGQQAAGGGPTGSGAGQPSGSGSQPSGGGSTGAGAGSGSSGAGSGPSAGASSGGTGANGQAPAACQTSGTAGGQSRPVANFLRNGVAMPQVAAFVVALFSLVAGYALGRERRRRPGAGT
jgi:hypothetical protein